MSLWRALGPSLNQLNTFDCNTIDDCTTNYEASPTETSTACSAWLCLICWDQHEHLNNIVLYWIWRCDSLGEMELLCDYIYLVASHLQFLHETILFGNWWFFQEEEMWPNYTVLYWGNTVCNCSTRSAKRLCRILYDVTHNQIETLLLMLLGVSTIQDKNIFFFLVVVLRCVSFYAS